MAGAGRLRFRSSQRLRQPAQFRQVYATARRVSNRYFSVSFLRNEAGHARLGLSIAARTVGNAVSRNRIRRLVRESFRLEQHLLPPVDIVVGARTAVVGAAAEDLRVGIGQLWKQVQEQCTH